MRVLVEQTSRAVRGWLEKLQLATGVHVTVLMGGEGPDDWDLYPENETILIGTQDMLLSAALNRGYGVSRYRWPIHFALTNNDSLWVFDEIQLMGSGLATTSQLQGLRSADKGLATCGPVHSLWMSATLEPDWLRTADFDPSSLQTSLALEAKDFENRQIYDRYSAVKILTKADTANANLRDLASEIMELHQPRTRTLVVVNTVGRARLLYQEITKRKPEAKLLLIHSRFRPPDRKAKLEQLSEEPRGLGTIVVSTQVIEAGVDTSAKTLFTELAPWASLVQRFGRCNRAGEFTIENPAQVRWIDLNTADDSARQKFAAPYLVGDLNLARQILEKLDGQSVASSTLDHLSVRLPFSHTHVIRRRDIVELFDTTPDLAGNDLDIDRYVRDRDDSDVRVFWRDLHDAPPQPDEPLPRIEELCPAKVGSFRQFLVKLGKAAPYKIRKAYRRNFVERLWEPVSERDIYPGQIYLLNSAVGGYDTESGWNGEVASKGSHPIAPVSSQRALLEGDEGNDADPWSQVGIWQTIAQHTDDVCHELEQILETLNLQEAQALRKAARWHDCGKAHPVFQSAIRDEHPTKGPRIHPWLNNRQIAKAPGKVRIDGRVADPGWWKPRYERRGFRHELASALAMLQLDDDHIPEDIRDLAIYLIGAHHGKIRLSIRSLPNEERPSGRRRFARGIWDGDVLPSVDLGNGVTAPAIILSLEPMELGHSSDGQPSWAERVLRLRDKLGAFRLAYLEALLRAADMRASASATVGEQTE
jgi:CRISPR-associated endonuclease/helicase Cas3